MTIVSYSTYYRKSGDLHDGEFFFFNSLTAGFVVISSDLLVKDLLSDKNDPQTRSKISHTASTGLADHLELIATTILIPPALCGRIQ